MKISEIQFRSFRSLVGLSFPTNARRVLVGGCNGVGKSSWRDVLRWTLTGEAGVDTDVLVPDFLGVPDVTASVVIDGIGRVERQWTPAGGQLRVTAFTGTPSVQQEALYEKLGTTKAYLNAVLDSRAFLTLHHADAKAILLGLLNVTVTHDGKDYTLDELDAAYKKAFADRREAKVVLKMTPMAVLPVWQGPTPPPPLKEINDKLALRRKELETLLQGAGHTTGERMSLQKRKEQLERPLVPSRQWTNGFTVEQVADRIAELEAQVEAMVDPPPPQATDDMNPEQRLTFLRGRRDALRHHQPKNGCVMDPDVPCETAKVKFTWRAKAINEEMEQTPAPIVPQPVEDPKAPLQVELRTLRLQHGHLLEDARVEAQRVANLADVTAALEALPDTSTSEAAILDLRGRIQKGEGIQKAVRTHTEAIQAYHAAVATLEGRTNAVARLEALCEALGPTGARVQALASALSGFEAAVNAVTGLFGWTLKIQVEPWDVLVNGRPAVTYSESQQFRVGIALQLAIAKLSGLDFAVVDEFDMLDKATRGIVGKMLFQADLGQVFILSTRDPDVPFSVLPDTICYRLGLQEQRTVVLEQVPA